MNRRHMISAMAGAAVVTATGISITGIQATTLSEKTKLKGNIHHSVSQWCYGDIPLTDLAKACVEMGIESIELLQEKDWATVNGFGLKWPWVMQPIGEFLKASTA